MCAVVRPRPSLVAVKKILLCSSALEVIHENGEGAVTSVGHDAGPCGKEGFIKCNVYTQTSIWPTTLLVIPCSGWTPETAIVKTEAEECKYIRTHLPEEKPSCWHAMAALLLSQESSHTVPHCPPRHTSTRPSSSVTPPASLNAPVVHRRPELRSGKSNFIISLLVRINNPH